MIQKIRMSMMTMKLQRRRKTNYYWGEKIHQSKRRRKLESRRILTKTQRKRKPHNVDQLTWMLWDGKELCTFEKLK